LGFVVAGDEVPDNGQHPERKDVSYWVVLDSGAETYYLSVIEILTRVLDIPQSLREVDIQRDGTTRLTTSQALAA